MYMPQTLVIDILQMWFWSSLIRVIKLVCWIRIKS